MFDSELFLGFPLHSLYEAKLEEIPHSLRIFFIQDHPDYLQQVTHDGISYLGKQLEKTIDLRTLDALEVHIFSLLKRLVPEYPYENTPLTFLPLTINS